MDDRILHCTKDVPTWGSRMYHLDEKKGFFVLAKDFLYWQRIFCSGIVLGTPHRPTGVLNGFLGYQKYKPSHININWMKIMFLACRKFSWKKYKSQKFRETLDLSRDFLIRKSLLKLKIRKSLLKPKFLKISGIFFWENKKIRKFMIFQKFRKSWFSEISKILIFRKFRNSVLLCCMLVPVDGVLGSIMHSKPFKSMI